MDDFILINCIAQAKLVSPFSESAHVQENSFLSLLKPLVTFTRKKKKNKINVHYLQLIVLLKLVCADSENN